MWRALPGYFARLCYRSKIHASELRFVLFVSCTSDFCDEHYLSLAVRRDSILYFYPEPKVLYSIGPLELLV